MYIAPRNNSTKQGLFEGGKPRKVLVLLGFSAAGVHKSLYHFRSLDRNVDYEFDTNAPYLHPDCTLNAPRAESWVHLSHFRSLSRVHLGSLGAPSPGAKKRNAHMALRVRERSSEKKILPLHPNGG